MMWEEKLYWFFRNLAAFILAVVCWPFYWLIKYLPALLYIVFKCDGSITLDWPWEWNWKAFDEED